MTQAVSRRYPFLPARLYRDLRNVFQALFRVLVRLHIEGLEHVPAQGPFIMLSNHLSLIDAPAVFVAMPRTLYVLAAEKYERNLFFGSLLRVAGAVFINRGEADRDAIRQTLALLEDGHCLGMAVEGTRSRTGGLQQGKAGAAYFATRAGVPILPAVCWGTEKVFPSLLRLRRAEVHVRFGPPIRLPAGRARSADLDRYTEELMVTLARMLPEEYRGIYRHHPAVAGSRAAAAGEPASPGS